MEETIKGSLVLQEIPVELEQKDGTIKHYILTEMDGASRNAYLNKLSGRLLVKDGKATGLKNYDGLQSFLIHLCLRYADTDKLVSEAEINKFPAKLQDRLFEKAQEISSVGEGAETEAGND